MNCRELCHAMAESLILKSNSEVSNSEYGNSQIVKQDVSAMSSDLWPRVQVFDDLFTTIKQ